MNTEDNKPTSLFEQMAELTKPITEETVESKVDAREPVYIAGHAEYDNRCFTDNTDTERALCVVMFKKGSEWQKEQSDKVIRELLDALNVFNESAFIWKDFSPEFRKETRSAITKSENYLTKP